MARRRSSRSSVIGMMLTMAGIYGVLAFAIARRARELAVRVAVGASGRDVVRLVAAHALRLVAAGAILGLLADARPGASGSCRRWRW